MDRIKYPLKRVDWDPNGERNTHNRGKSKFKRISWDEATDIIAGEIRRIHKEYGPNGILVQGDGHGETKAIHIPHGQSSNLLEKMGGFSQSVRNADSWEEPPPGSEDFMKTLRKIPFPLPAANWSFIPRGWLNTFRMTRRDLQAQSG